MGNTIKANLDPNNPPEPGFVLNDQGFVYTLKSARPHRNLNGDSSLITVWDCICAEDGAHFEEKRGAKIYNLPRRCKAHNIGWVKAYPFGAPKPDNAPMASGVALQPAIKRFVDDFGVWIDRETWREEGRINFPCSPSDANRGFDLLAVYLEERFPGILDEPDATDLLS